MLLIHHPNYRTNLEIAFLCHVLPTIRTISRGRQVLVGEIVTMTPEEAGAVIDVVVDVEVEADEVTAADSVRIEDSQIDHLILIAVIKDGDHLVAEVVVGDQMTEIKDRRQDHVEEIMYGVMTTTTNAVAIVDHVVAAEVVVVAMISVAEVVDVVVAVEEAAVAEMEDHGAEIEIAVVVVVEALQVYHEFTIHLHHAVEALGEIDLHLEWNDVNHHHHHLVNLRHAVVVVVDGAMHLLQQVAPVVVEAVGAVVRRVENHHLAAPDGAVVAVVVKPHQESLLLIEVNHRVVVVDGVRQRNHLGQHHGDHQPKNRKKKNPKVGEVQALQLPVPNLQLVGKNHQPENSPLRIHLVTTKPCRFSVYYTCRLT